MSLDYEFTTVLKLSDWAGELDGDIDFIDYWYNLFLSDVKFEIEDDFGNNINAFHWNRWKNDFETAYEPQKGDGFSRDKRYWFAQFTQYLIFSLKVYSRDFAIHYKKEIFSKLMADWFQFHCFGVDASIERFIDKYGLHPKAKDIAKLKM